MLDRFKNKFSRHKQVKGTKETQSSVSIPSRAPGSNPPTERGDESSDRKTTTPPERPDVQRTEQDDPPPQDLWRLAITQMTPDKQNKLRKMGLGDSESGSVESEINQIVDAVNKKREECEQKFWRISREDKEDVVLRDYTARINQIITWVQKGGDIALQFAPSQASGPWALVKAFMQIPIMESSQMDALMTVTEKIVPIIGRGHVYEQVYLSSNDTSSEPLNSLRNTLLKVYTACLELLADSGNLFSQNTGRRTLEALLKPEAISSSLSALTKEEETLSRDVQACESSRNAASDAQMLEMLDNLYGPLIRVDKNLKMLVDISSKDEHLKMLEWISSVRFGDHHNKVNESRTPGTGEWLLQDQNFDDWKVSDSSGIFLLQGSPGAGKTYLTSRVIDFFQKMLNDPPKDEGFAFFYLDKNDKTRQGAHALFQSYVRQLSTTPNRPGSILGQLKAACEEAQKKSSKLSFEMCKDHVSKALNLYPRSTLIIDALDECAESRNKLIDALNTLVSESKSIVKIFISSRPDQGTKHRLHWNKFVSIEAADNQADIREFLERELEELAKDHDPIKELQVEIADKLTERSNGMFLWASLQVRQISKQRTARGIWNRLKNLPNGLQKAYDEIWDDIENLEEPDKTLTKRALQWVWIACEPMKTNMLLSAVRVGKIDDDPFISEEISKKDLLTLSNYFLVLDSKQGVWRFPHLSVKEYLEAKHDWTSVQAHRHAAAACLSLLIDVYQSEPQHANWPYYSAEWDDYINLDHGDGIADEDSDEDWDIDHPLNPFNVYARHCWVIHVHGSESPKQSTVACLLKTFLGAPNESSIQYRRWLARILEDPFLFTNSSNWDVCGFDRSLFSKYRYEVIDADSWPYTATELEPGEISLFAMCRFSFDDILWDWWDAFDIEPSTLNRRGHDLLTVAAIGGSAKICNLLITKGADVNFPITAVDELDGDRDQEYGSALVAASHKGQKHAVKCLVEAGADVNKHYHFHEGCFPTALVAAIEGGHFETVKYLVQEAKSDVKMPADEYDNHGSALARAVFNGSFEMMKCLVDAGANPNEPLGHHEYYSALEAAAHMSQLESVKYLVQNGADANMALWSGKRYLGFGSALEAAASRGVLDIVKYLVEEGHAKVGVANDYGEGSPLVAAIMTSRHGYESPDIDHTATFKYLVQEARADLNMPLRCGYYGSALAAGAFWAEHASWAGELNILKALIEAGADVNMSLSCGRYGSALEAAESFNEVKVLLEAGAVANTKSLFGDYGSPIAAAASRGSLDSVKILLSSGADANMELSVGEFGSALAAASASPDNLKMVKFLLDAGVDANMQLSAGKYGSALAAVAASQKAIEPASSHAETVKCLLEAGADANVTLLVGDYGSALVAAARSANIECVQILLKAGADPNKQVSVGKYGNALVAAACSSYDNKVVECLLEAGADPNVPSSCGDYGSALAAAVRYDFRTNIAPSIIHAGADVNMPLPFGKFSSAWEVLFCSSDFIRRDMFKALVAAKVDVNTPFTRHDFGHAITRVAAYYNGSDDPELLELLLAAGADVNRTHADARYGSPLIAAAYFGARDTVKRLIDAGADVNLRLKDSSLATALQVARLAATKENIKEFPERIAWKIFGDERAVEFKKKAIEKLDRRRAEVAELLIQRGAKA